MKVTTILLVMMIMCGCYTGNQRLSEMSVEDVHVAIVAKKTTKTDVVNMFGQPMAKSIGESKVFYNYWSNTFEWYMLIPPIIFINQPTHKELSIKFADDDSVDDYRMWCNK